MRRHVRVNYGLCRFVHFFKCIQEADARTEEKKGDLTSTKSQGALIGLNLQLILSQKFYLTTVLEKNKKTFPLWH